MMMKLEYLSLEYSMFSYLFLRRYKKEEEEENVVLLSYFLFVSY